MFVFSSILLAITSIIIRSITAQVLPKEILSTKAANCGVLLAGLTSNCADVRHSIPPYCCNSLKEWNENLCWCDKNAFKAASNLAMDVFAFQFRAGNCNIMPLFRPEITLPVASRKIISNTCPMKASSQPEVSLSEPCENAGSETNTHQLRMEVLERLSKLDLLRPTDIANWSRDVDTMFAPDAVLFSIGSFFSFPRINVKKTLLTRSTCFGGVPWQSVVDMKSLEWSSSDSVSYQSRSSYGSFSFERVEFVSFEKHSSRISQLIVQEEEAVRLFSQFVYFEPSDRVFWRTRRSSVSWCRDISRTCRSFLFPFQRKESCLSTYMNLQSARASCASHGPRTSLIAMHGNTQICRNMYLTLAQLNPKRYCPLLGARGLALCRKNGCPDNWYDNIFETRNPRFDSTVSYRCSSENCWEDWPAKGGDVGYSYYEE